MAYISIGLKTRLIALALVPLLGACSPAGMPQSGPQATGASLSQDEIAKAVAVAKRVVADQGATVSSASAIAVAGTTEESNTGSPCTSGRELQIKLIGTFPRAVTTGTGGPTASPASSPAVRAMLITADAASGRACLIRVQTGDSASQSLPGGVTLSLA
jgi:hypothetical protein